MTADLPVFTFYRDGAKFIVRIAGDKSLYNYFFKRATNFFNAFGDTILFKKINEVNGSIVFEVECELLDDVQYVKSFLGSLKSDILPKYQFVGGEKPPGPNVFWGEQND